MRRCIVDFSGWIGVRANDEEDALDKAFGPLHQALLPIREAGREITWSLMGTEDDEFGNFSVDFQGQIEVTARQASSATNKAEALLGTSLNEATRFGRRGDWSLGAVTLGA